MSKINKFSDASNVKDFGAVGDGVTDDTDSMQNAANNGGNIYVPPGVYIITRAIVLKSNTTIDGVLGESILKKHATIYTSEVFPWETGSENVKNILTRNMSMEL
jgi:polygalacturonase